MHKHRVTHRLVLSPAPCADLVSPSDCSYNNIMMDPSRLYIDAFHLVSPLMKQDFLGYARCKTRTE